MLAIVGFWYTDRMQKKKRAFWQVVGFDAAAVVCFIGVIAFGWLPGPGGIPLFLLGLSLLAANHDWAERWLDTAKHKGVSFRKWIFPDIAWIQMAYDVVSVAFFSGAATSLVYNKENRIVSGVCVVILFVSLFVFLVNRNRFDKMSTLFKRKR